MKIKTLICSGLLLVASGSASAVTVAGGVTSVLLDTNLLSTAAGLTLSSATGTVGGSLPGSVGFTINPTTAPTLPTTFEYTSGNFPGGPFSGEINHTGSVLFNGDTVEVGNFRIGFDGNRASGSASGFFVESTTGVAAILFDIGVTGIGEASDTALQIDGDLLVSPEFATFLGDQALTGADVGDAQVNASPIPEPTSLLTIAVAGLFGIARRRR